MFYSPGPAQPLRILFDYHHRARPRTKVGNHLITGSWVDNVGRYGWDDFVHTNSFDPVFVALEKEYAIAVAEEPLTAELLANTDIVVIPCPESPRKAPDVAVLADAEIAALREFVVQGGSLLLMINGGTPGRAHEDFESIQLRKLVQGFGLDWNDDDTHYANIRIGSPHPFFYDIPIFHYGAGCTLRILPEAQRPSVLLEVYADDGIPDLQVKGPGFVLVRPGKGKFILVGDIGSWTANLSRPWAENARVLQQLFRYLKPDRGVVQPQLNAGESWEYAVTVSGMQAIPVENTLGQIARPHYKLYFARPGTGMPYLEGNATLRLDCTERTADQTAKLTATISGFRWFDESVQGEEGDTLRFSASRQGKVSGIETDGPMAQWLAADIPAIIALLPVDGVRPGDRWESLEPLRVPILQGAGLAPVKTIAMDIQYVADTEMNDRPCRLLRASGEVWLDSIGVRIEDLLPAEEVRRPGGAHYRFYAERGGKLLYKREQWVDALTGIVVHARMQSRIVCWVRDRDKAVGLSNAEKDQEMVISLAQTVSFALH
jgi:hypothetical protein